MQDYSHLIQQLSFAIGHVVKLTVKRRLYLEEEVADSPQTISDAGFGFPQPVIVRDADIVHVFQESVLSSKHQVIQALWAWFLHPFKAEFDVDGKLLHNKEQYKI